LRAPAGFRLAAQEELPCSISKLDFGLVNPLLKFAQSLGKHVVWNLTVRTGRTAPPLLLSTHVRLLLQSCALASGLALGASTHAVLTLHSLQIRVVESVHVVSMPNIPEKPTSTNVVSLFSRFKKFLKHCFRVVKYPSTPVPQ
jgi:hypothetical protein